MIDSGIDYLETIVIIPAYNSEATIARAILSCKILGLNMVIVVDDGSTDGTAESAALAGARVIRQKNQGASVARSRGFDEFSSNFVIFLDADDELMPGMVDAIKMLSMEPNAAVVGGSVQMRGASRGHFKHGYNSPPRVLATEDLISLPFAPWPQSASVWRSSFVTEARQTAPPALQPRFAEDFELLIRGSLVGEVVRVANVTCLYSAVGGKSATNAVMAVQQSERVRSYYASFSDKQIRLLRAKEIEDQARWRIFRGQLSTLGLVKATCMIILSPAHFISVIRHQLRAIPRHVQTSFKAK